LAPDRRAESMLLVVSGRYKLIRYHKIELPPTPEPESKAVSDKHGNTVAHHQPAALLPPTAPAPSLIQLTRMAAGKSSALSSADADNATQGPATHSNVLQHALQHADASTDNETQRGMPASAHAANTRTSTATPPAVSMARADVDAAEASHRDPSQFHTESALEAEKERLSNKGTVKIEEQEVVVTVGHVMGEEAFLRNADVDCSVVCLEKGKLLKISRWAVTPLLAVQPHLLSALDPS